MIMVKVFQMMKAPTKSAMPAKTVNRTPTIFRSSLMASAFSFETVAPVTASAPVGTTASSRRASSFWEIPSSPATPIVSKSPRVPSTRCAVATSKYADVVPPRSFSPPKPTVPTTVNSRVGPWNSTWMVEPSSMSFSSALVASIATWVGPFGAVPDRMSTSPRSASSSAIV